MQHLRQHTRLHGEQQTHHEALSGTVFFHSNGESRGVKGGLADPRRKHSALSIPVFHCHHAEGAHDSSHGLLRACRVHEHSSCTRPCLPQNVLLLMHAPAGTSSRAAGRRCSCGLLGSNCTVTYISSKRACMQSKGTCHLGHFDAARAFLAHSARRALALEDSLREVCPTLLADLHASRPSTKSHSLARARKQMGTMPPRACTLIGKESKESKESKACTHLK
jgi:hypothetical protein